MSRWHTIGCAGGDEDILVNPNGLPSCQSCKSSPDIPRLLTQLGEGFPGLQVPQDEPPGQLNLSWPPTVPYSKSIQIDDTTRSASPDLDIHALFETGTGTSSEPSSPVYPKVLRPDEFRLLVLDSHNTPTHGDEKTHDRPVHIDLETHRDNQHPEYETVSYTWGGENDDSSPSQPVYVGPCWDALFQTKNCHDMLRRLRPKRGIRFLWVDAICINQNDADERAQQVSKMQTIYSNAWRVVVYLGSDIVTPIPNRSLYPVRRRLEDLATSEEGESLVCPDLSLRQVLERRYFSRIWVIQELLLSRSICIRIRDMELIIDRPAQPTLLGDGQSSNESDGPDWNATKAPWVAHATQGTVSDPIALLQMVGLSRASDPRDKIFGIIGLLHPSLSLIPDYSLSLLRARVGFAAHILLNGNAPEILLHPGPRHMGQHPSWVPWPLSKDTLWRRRTRGMDKSWEEILEKFYQGLGSDYSVYIPDDNYLFDDHQQYGAGKDRADHAANCPAWQERKYWRAGAHVDAANGSLSIRLVHLMPLKSMPVQIRREDGFIIMRLEAPSTFVRRWGMPPWEFSLVFQDSPHGLDLIPEVDHIFILHGKSREAGPQFIILRPSPDRPLTFRLVACCHRVFVCGAHDKAWKLAIADLRNDLIPSLKTTQLHSIMHYSFLHDPWTASVRLACLMYHGHKTSPAFPLHLPLGGLKYSTVMCALRTALSMILRPDLEPRILNFQGVDCIELHLLHSNMRRLEVQQVIVTNLNRARQEMLLRLRTLDELPALIPKARFWRRGDIWTLHQKLPNVYTDICDRHKASEIFDDIINSRSEDMSSFYVLFPIQEDIRTYIQGNQEPELEILNVVGRDKWLETGKARKDTLSMALKWIKAKPPRSCTKLRESRVKGTKPKAQAYCEVGIHPDDLLAAPRWPRELVEAFSIDGSTYQVTIT
ncbi:hypothetical protein RB595_002160 [Gaeumannomyces hyphopodioides]